MSLRTRLLAGVLFLVTVALVVAAVSIYAEQRSYLLTHLDQRVIAAATPLSYQLGVDARLLSHHVSPETSTNRAHPAVSPLGRGLAEFLPSGTYGELVDPGGRLLRGPVTIYDGEAVLPPPRLPKRLPVASSGGPALFTVNSTHGSGPALPRGHAAADDRRGNGRRGPAAARGRPDVARSDRGRGARRRGVIISRRPRVGGDPRRACGRWARWSAWRVRSPTAT